MNLELESMAVEMPEVEGHPNRVEFRGVLTFVDVPSQAAPGGANGSRVLLTRKAAEEALPSLIGMALDYSPEFDGHDARRKVGVITSANVVGRNLEIGGYLYARDFPEIVEEIRKSGRRTHVGMAAAYAGPAKDSRCSGTGLSLRRQLSQAIRDIRSVLAGASKKFGLRPALSLRAEAAGGSGTGLGMSFEATNVSVVDRRAKVWIIEGLTFTGAAILRKGKAAYRETWIELS